MGYNLSGLLIKPAVTDKTLLEQALGWKLVDETTVSFEEASLNKYDNAYVDIYHTAQGTLVLSDQAFYEREQGLKQLSKGGELLVFGLSETAMVFFFQQFAGGQLQWEDGVSMDGEGERLGNSHLNLDEDTDIVFDTFGELTVRYLGANFHQVPLETPITRYRVERFMVNDTTVPPVRAEEAFPLFNQFLTKVGQNQVPVVEEAPGKKVYSFETYLRAQHHAPPMAAAYAAFMKANMEAFNQWRKPSIWRTTAGFYVYVGLILLVVHGVLYGLLALLVPALASWPGYGLTLIGVLAGYVYLTRKNKQRLQPTLQLKYLDSDTFPEQ